MAVFGIEDTTELAYIVFTDEVTGRSYDTRDWGFFTAPIMRIPDAQARRIQQQVPGMDGMLDLTDALGGVKFENRELEFQLVYDNGTEAEFHETASMVRNLLDGRRMRVNTSEDPEWYWSGRCQVGAEKVGRRMMSLAVTVDADPYKHSVTSSYEVWMWDPFSFVDGEIPSHEDVELDDSTETVDLPRDPSESKVVLWLTSGTSGAVRARMADSSTWHVLRSWRNTFADVRMSKNDETQIVLEGTGTVGVDYRVSSL